MGGRDVYHTRGKGGSKRVPAASHFGGHTGGHLEEGATIQIIVVGGGAKMKQQFRRTTDSFLVAPRQ